MGGGRSSMDTGVRKSRTYGGNKVTPMSRQEEYAAKLRQATSSQRLGRAMGGGKKRGMYAEGGLANAMPKAKAN